MCLERYIVEQCAPTLASIKTGALFGVIDPDTEELLRQAEEAVAATLGQIRETRGKFTAMTNPRANRPSPIIEDI